MRPIEVIIQSLSSTINNNLQESVDFVVIERATWLKSWRINRYKVKELCILDSLFNYTENGLEFTVSTYDNDSVLISIR